MRHQKNAIGLSQLPAFKVLLRKFEGTFYCESMFQTNPTYHIGYILLHPVIFPYVPQSKHGMPHAQGFTIVPPHYRSIHSLMTINYQLVYEHHSNAILQISTINPTVKLVLKTNFAQQSILNPMKNPVKSPLNHQ